MIEVASGHSSSSAVIKAAGVVYVDGAVAPAIFLRRLRRLLLLRFQAAQYFDQLDVRLLDRCIYTTYCDCVELGVSEPARQLLREARSSHAAPAGSA